MSKNYTQVTIGTDTFAQWISLTNEMALGFADVVTIAANSTGDLTTGNGYVSGIFGANSIVATNIRGGTVSTSTSLGLTSNLVISGAQVNSTSNTYLVSSNVYTISNNYVVGSNASVNAVSVLGNSTATAIALNGNTVTFNGNSTFANVVSMSSTLAVTGNVTLAGDLTVATHSAFSSNTASLSGTSAQLVDTFSATTYRGGKYVLSLTDTGGSSYQMTEILVMHDGSTAYTTEYATLRSGSNLATISANVSGSTVRVYVSPTVSAITLKLNKTLTAV